MTKSAVACFSLLGEDFSFFAELSGLVLGFSLFFGVPFLSDFISFCGSRRCFLLVPDRSMFAWPSSERLEDLEELLLAFEGSLDSCFESRFDDDFEGDLGSDLTLVFCAVFAGVFELFFSSCSTGGTSTLPKDLLIAFS